MGDAVLRNRRGEPITGRHDDRLFVRARECLGWDDRTPVSAHVLRLTAITRIGRIAGYPVAQAFARPCPTDRDRPLPACHPRRRRDASGCGHRRSHPLAHPIRDSFRRSCT